MSDPERECQRLRETASLEELLEALRNLSTYDANQGDPYGGNWPVSVAETAAEVLASRGQEVVPRLLELAREGLWMAARALALSTADLTPRAEALLRLYLSGPELVSQELGHRLARMDLSELALESLESHPVRVLRLLRLEDGVGLERALERVPELLKQPQAQEAALDALYVKPVEPWLSQSREALISMLKGPCAERAATVLGYLRDGCPALADLALSAPSSRLAGVALKALAQAPPERLDPLLDRLMTLADPDRTGRLMAVLKQARQPRTRGFIQEFLQSVPADSWQAESGREALSVLP